MKVFTVDEANKLLIEIIPKLKKIKANHEIISTLSESVKAAAASAQFGGGGTENGTNYVKSLFEIGKLTTEIIEMGIQIKDYKSGLIDFPTWRDGKMVLLCWQMGEEEEIRWWHEVETGFAGRKPL